MRCRTSVLPPGCNHLAYRLMSPCALILLGKGQAPVVCHLQRTLWKVDGEDYFFLGSILFQLVTQQTAYIYVSLHCLYAKWLSIVVDADVLLCFI